MKALVLSGGGAKGAYQWGALEQLIIHNKVQFDRIYGTSVGALNAIGLACIGVEGISNIWNSIEKTNDIFAKNWLTLGPIFGDAMYNYKPLEKLLRNNFLGREVQITLTVTKVNIETGELVYVSKQKGDIIDEDFIKSVIASTSVPLVSDPVDDIWFDGGIREITPLHRAIDDGALEITAILCNPPKPDPDYKVKDKGLFKGIKKGLRTIDIIAHEIMLNDLIKCKSRNGKASYKNIDLKVYAPPILVTETDQFNQLKIQAAREQGRQLDIPLLFSNF